MPKHNGDSGRDSSSGGYDSLDDETEPVPLELTSEERIRRQIELEEAQNVSDPKRAKRDAEGDRDARRKRVGELNPLDLWGMVRALIDGLGESASHVGAAKGYLRQSREIYRAISDRIKTLEDDHDEIKSDIRGLPAVLTSELSGMSQRLAALEQHCAEARGAFPKGPKLLGVFRKLVETAHEFPRASIVVAAALAAVAAAIIWGGEGVGLLMKLLLGAG